MDVASYVAGKICRWRFLGEKMVQTVTWVSGCQKSLRSDLSISVYQTRLVQDHGAWPFLI